MIKKKSAPPERSLTALRALERASRVAKKLAFETNTYFITEKDGKVIKEKITAKDL